MRQPIEFPFQRGVVSAATTTGEVTIGSVNVFPYSQPQPYFVVTNYGQRVKFSTDGELFLKDNIGEQSTPILVLCGHAFLASLMILPPDRRITLHDVNDMRVTADRNGLLMVLAGPRFGLPAGSAILFSSDFNNKLHWKDITELSNYDG